MIMKDIKIFSQNVHKNNFVINTILEIQDTFNIIFIQEPSWSFICSIPSFKNKKREELVGVLNHPNWITFFRNPSNSDNSPKVITYINIRLSSFQFSLQKNIFNHGDVSIVFFFNCGSVYFLVNIYSDLLQLALKILKSISTMF